MNSYLRTRLKSFTTSSAGAEPKKAKEANPISEAQFSQVRWLYRIRNSQASSGRLIFLQPDFILFLFGPLLPDKRFLRTQKDIKRAVDAWCENGQKKKAEAEKQYGHISHWDVSSVFNMSGLFENKLKFNDDISRWDVSNATDMTRMFKHARAFNQPIGNWNVSSVKRCTMMFNSAPQFNQAIGDWDVSKVTDMRYMFYQAVCFNQSIASWNVSRVTEFENMFCNASAFNQPLDRWDVSAAVNFKGMFHGADSFNKDISTWKIQSGLTASKRDMFQPTCKVACCKKPKVILKDDCSRWSTKVLAGLRNTLIAAAPLVLWGYFIYFLSVDHNKGGACADTTCRQIWNYTLVKLCSYVVLPCLLALPRMCRNDSWQASMYMSAFLLQIGMFAYGGVVLIRDDPCTQCKNTGLFQISYVWYIIDVTTTLLAICLFLWIMFYGFDDD